MAAVVGPAAFRLRRFTACFVVIGLAMLSACSASGRAATSTGGKTTTSVKASTSAAVGPFLSDPTDPTKRDTHWHAALGVYACDHWMSDGTGAGIWQWPTATPQGVPARAENRKDRKSVV